MLVCNQYILVFIFKYLVAVIIIKWLQQSGIKKSNHGSLFLVYDTITVACYRFNIFKYLLNLLFAKMIYFCIFSYSYTFKFYFDLLITIFANRKICWKTLTIIKFILFFFVNFLLIFHFSIIAFNFDYICNLNFY